MWDMQRSCAYVRSHYKRKCWTNSRGHLGNSLLWALHQYIQWISFSLVLLYNRSIPVLGSWTASTKSVMCLPLQCFQFLAWLIVSMLVKFFLYMKKSKNSFHCVSLAPKISKVYLGSKCTAVHIGWDLATPPPPIFGLIYEGAIGQPR